MLCQYFSSLHTSWPCCKANRSRPVCLQFVSLFYLLQPLHWKIDGVYMPWFWFMEPELWFQLFHIEKIPVFLRIFFSKFSGKLTFKFKWINIYELLIIFSTMLQRKTFLVYFSNLEGVVLFQSQTCGKLLQTRPNCLQNDLHHTHEMANS